MHLDSARELKKVLLDSVVTQLATPIQARQLGVPARPSTAGAGTPATIALGAVRKKKHDFILAVRVQQRALENSKHIATIRTRARGEVEVRYIGRVAKRAAPWHQQRNRPLRMGGSAGHFKITAGTLGCFVQDRQTSAVLLLSNNHVLANENRAKIGDNILQPGAFDGGENPTDAVGTLAHFIKLKRTGVNSLDCAVAVVKEGIGTNHRNLTGIGKLAGLGD
jgi:hypothetical protein